MHQNRTCVRIDVRIHNGGVYMKKKVVWFRKNSMYFFPLSNASIFLLLTHLGKISVSNDMIPTIISMSSTFLGFSFTLQTYLASTINNDSVFSYRLKNAGWFDVLNKNFSLSYFWHFVCIAIGIFDVCTTPVVMAFILGLSNNAVSCYFLAQISNETLNKKKQHKN